MKVDSKVFLSGVVAVGLALCSVAQQQKMIVVVDKFENEAGAPDSYFQTLRSRITDNIINTRKFDVMERQRLASVLSERKLADAGITAEEGAPEAGKIKAASFILYGSVLSMGVDSNVAKITGVAAAKETVKVEIQLRISNGETGKIIASKTIVAIQSQSRLAGSGQSVSGNVKDQAMTDAIRLAAKKVTGALMDLAYPAKILKVKTSDMLINLTQEQTEFGAVYEVFQPGEEITDPDTGESLGSTEELIGEVVISRTMPKFSMAKPVGEKSIDAFKRGMIVRRQDEAIAKQKARAAKEKAVKSFESRF